MLQVAGHTKAYRKHTDVFMGYLFLFSFLGLISFFAGVAQSEGQVTAHGLLAFLADHFYWMFPLTLISITFRNPSFLIFLSFLVVNISIYAMLFSFLTGRFIFKLHRYKPFDFTFYSSLLILLLVVIGFVSVIVR
jgi:hypothetical protein